MCWVWCVGVCIARAFKVMEGRCAIVHTLYLLLDVQDVDVDAQWWYH